MKSKRRYEEPSLGEAVEISMAVALAISVLFGIAWIINYGMTHHKEVTIVLIGLVGIFITVVALIYWIPRFLNRPTQMEKILYEQPEPSERKTLKGDPPSLL